jgi:lysophospholipase L1-like esterase
MLGASIAGALVAGVARASEPRAAPANETAWHVVAIGDSTPAGWGQPPDLAYPTVYGALLAADLGIEVVVVNHATATTRTVAHWAEHVRTDEGIAHDLATARVVLVWLGWHDILPIVYRRTQAHWPQPMRTQLITKNDELVGAWHDLLAALRNATGPSCVLLVADTGLIGFLPAQFGREAYWPELKRLVYLDWRDALVQAAEAAGALVVPTMRALGGPDGEVDLHPELASSDGLHFNAAGHRFLAEQHRAHDGITMDAIGSGVADR